MPGTLLGGGKLQANRGPRGIQPVPGTLLGAIVALVCLVVVRLVAVLGNKVGGFGGKGGALASLGVPFGRIDSICDCLDSRS